MCYIAQTDRAQKSRRESQNNRETRKNEEIINEGYDIDKKKKKKNQTVLSICIGSIAEKNLGTLKMA